MARKITLYRSSNGCLFDTLEEATQVNKDCGYSGPVSKTIMYQSKNGARFSRLIDALDDSAKFNIDRLQQVQEKLKSTSGYPVYDDESWEVDMDYYDIEQDCSWDG